MQHGEYIEQFSKGQFYNNISEDPRDTIESDEKISLANFAGYKSQKTLAPKGVKQTEVDMSEEAEKNVKRIADIIMNKVGLIRQRKLELAAPVQAEAMPESEKPAIIAAEVIVETQVEESVEQHDAVV
jgi:hypothetical protein